ncbi:sensor histidine kinase [Microbacterium sp. MRS-1]|jgi:signal transduction histidine kinase|uniref:sensor histidine kinase n=1 Tax=Microbacterium sp. MRS-1 TaxID=1451261 RepID=UPI00031268F1|nr:HAMP domain-containing sensor histidine kinase [Microbacterium sp. MRS-1]EXJ53272.1 hypothetical protein AS96_00155 [Microbacterium sp. MRS-1]
MSMASRRTGSAARGWGRRSRRACEDGPLVLSTLNEIVGEAVIVTDERGIPRRLNDPARAAFARAGLPEKLSAGAEYRDLRFFHADRVTPIALGPQLLREVASKGNAIPYTTWVGEGVEQRAMSIAARPFRDQRGARRGAVIVARDMTTVFEASRIRDDFLRDAAHRLRGHLTTVAGYADLLESHTRAGEIGGRLSRATQQLVDMVDDLFRTAREDTARSIPPSDVSAALSDVCGVFLGVAAARGVALHVIDEGCGSVRFEQTELRQVLADLLSYAIGHCRTAGRIVVRAHRDHHRTTVSVADDGVHTSDDERRRQLAHLMGADDHRTTTRDPALAPRHAVRANQATLSVRPDHPVGTIASLVMIAV